MSGSIRTGLDNGKSGYSLVELLVVVALLAIIFSIARPSISWYVNFKEKSDLKEFKRDLIAARNSAVVDNCSYSVYLDLARNGYQVYKYSEGSKKIKDKRFSHGLILKDQNFDKAYVSFHATGSPEKAGTISLTNSRGQAIEITIEVATGKVNLKYK